eukprot:CAMPEP_0117449950 /NCGR_PEP_ID=MMETSP0759-20121206/8213_1 /TAXON_ID=63605 /ORGANISM="Percolomonas cosmopolitus, Strain WS" /LENGTH=976 /DNA_ID=CAMNT_0005242449 /DNA_START=19 /DNA_END=2945 /DNA_ORIENTATION=+
MPSSLSQPLQSLPLIPSGIFQAPIIFSNASTRPSMKRSSYTGRLEPEGKKTSKSSSSSSTQPTHFHISSQNILFTFSYPTLKRLNAIDFSHLNSAIIHMASHNNRLIVIFANGIVEMRDMDDISIRLGHWESQFKRALKWKFADSIVVDGTLRVYGVEEIDDDWYTKRIVIDFEGGKVGKDDKDQSPLSATTLISDAIYPYYRGATDQRHKIHGISINNAETIMTILTTTMFYFVHLRQNSQGEMSAKGGSKIHQKDACLLRYMPQGDAYLVGTQLGDFRLYLPKQTVRLHKHAGKITYANLMQNGKYLAVCSKEGKISVHNVKNMKAPPKVYYLNEHVRHFAVSPTQNAFVVVTRSNRMRVVDITASGHTTQYVAEYDGLHAPLSERKSLQLVAPNTRSDVLLVQGLPCLQFYNLSSGHSEQFINLHNQVPEINIFGQTHSNFKVRSLRVNCVAFSHDDSLMATAEYMAEEVSIKLWTKTASQGYVLKTVLDSPHTDAVVQLLFSPDSSKLISCGKDNAAKVWDLTNEEIPCVHMLSHSNRVINAACFSRDGSVLSIVFQKRITFWDAEKYELQRECRVDLYSVRTMDFISDVGILLSTHDTVWYFSLRTMQMLWKYQFRHQQISVAVNPHRENEFALTSTHIKHNTKGRVYLVSCGDDIEQPHFVSYPTNAAQISVRFLDDSRFVTLSSSMELRVYSTTLERSLEAPHEEQLEQFESKMGLKKQERLIAEPGEEMDNDAMTTNMFDDSSAALELTHHHHRAMQLKRHKQDPVRGRGPWNELFSAPSHALPSSSDVFDSFMDAFLIRKDAQVDHVDLLGSGGAQNTAYTLGASNSLLDSDEDVYRFNNAKTLELHKGGIKLKFQSNNKSEKQGKTNPQFEPLRMKIDGNDVVVNRALWERNGKVMSEDEKKDYESLLRKQVGDVFAQVSWSGKGRTMTDDSSVAQANGRKKSRPKANQKQSNHHEQKSKKRARST